MSNILVTWHAPAQSCSIPLRAFIFLDLDFAGAAGLSMRALVARRQSNSALSTLHAEKAAPVTERGRAALWAGNVEWVSY
jgi:hypothetical protein